MNSILSSLDMLTHTFPNAGGGFVLDTHISLPGLVGLLNSNVSCGSSLVDDTYDDVYLEDCLGLIDIY